MKTHRHIAAKLAPSAINIAAVLLLSLVAWSPCSGQTGKGLSLDPDDLPGFANNVFHLHDPDAINLYNGNLTIPIAVGPNYPLANDLSYQLSIVYNARPWQFGHYDGGSPGFWDMVEVGIPNLGLGWSLNPGQITQRPFCNAGSITGYYLDAYVSADGGRHQLTPNADGNSYTTDGTRLRFSKLADGTYQMTDPDGRTYLFAQIVLPALVYAAFGRSSGITDNDCANQGIFHDFGVGLDGYYLTRITSAKDSTAKVEFSYNAAAPWLLETVKLYQPNNPTSPASISISAGGSPIPLISQIGFPVTGGGPPAIWSIQHATAQKARPYRSANSGTSTPTIAFLNQIALPTGETYQFGYFDAVEDATLLGVNLWQAALQSMKLPTGATITYQYANQKHLHHNRNKYETWCPQGSAPGAPTIEGMHPLLAPAGDCKPAQDAMSFGVIARTVSGSAADGTIKYSWKQLLCGEASAESLTNCPSARPSEGIMLVELPPNADGKQVWEKHRFLDSGANGASDPRTGAEIESATFTGHPFAAPYSSNSPICGSAADGSGDQGPCGTKAVRVETTDYGSSCLNERTVISKKTFYGGWSRDYTRPVATPHVDTVWFDLDETSCPSGSGLFRKRSITSNLDTSPVTRTETTNWTADTTRWLLNLYSFKSVTDPSGTSQTDYVFDAANGGRLTSISNTDSTYGKVSHTLSNFAKGNPQTETFSTSTLGASNNTGLDGKSYTKTNAFWNGHLRNAFWGTLGWKSPDVDRDPITGRVTFSRDTSKLATGYAYDAIGRVTKITPPGEAATFVCYDATTTTAYRGSSQLTCPVSASTAGILTWQQLQFDGLGRLVKERLRMPGGSLVMRVTEYDPAGHTSSVSEWVTDSGSAPSQKTVSSNFDPFGRVRQIKKADGSITRLSFDDGTIPNLDTVKTVMVDNVGGNCSNGSCTGGATASTTHRSDAFGHLLSVMEADGKTTQYGYDVDDKLICVKQGGAQLMSSCTDNPGGQFRHFTYDMLGFLRQEVTPEKGAVNYLQYDALGNLTKSLEPNNNTLTRTYEASAGRLWKLDSSEGRNYLTNTFDDTSSTASLGKVTQRTSLTVNAQGSLPVTEIFGYDGSNGKLAFKRLTLPGTAALFETDWTYDALGPVKSVTQLIGGVQKGLLEYTYDNGYLATVNGQPAAANKIGLVLSASYQPHGGLASFDAGSGYKTTIDPDPAGLPRPAKIYTWNQVSVPWNSGSYLYDGAGNVKSIGTQSYDYDLLSRITKATVNGQVQTFAYDQWSNLTNKGGQVFALDGLHTNRLATSTIISYDPLGNLTQYGNQLFTYDTLSRQTDFSDTSASVLPDRYVYDGAGERVARYGAVPALPPLTILTDPTSSLCSQALPISINLVAVGGEGPPYTWTATKTDGSALPTGVSLVGDQLVFSAAGSYVVLVTVKDSGGNTTSTTLTIGVSTTCNAIWESQPQDFVVCPGQSYSATAAAHYEDPPPAGQTQSVVVPATYRWEMRGIDGSWIPATGSVTPCTYYFTQASCFSAIPSADPTYYRAVATRQGNGLGATSSRIATVWIGGPIRINRTQNNLICLGQTTNLDSLVDALGCNLTTSWQKQNSDGSYTDLTSSFVSPTQNSFYRCVLRADSPTQTAFAGPVEVDVLPQPVLTQAPVSQNVCAGSSVTLTATSNTPGYFKWEHFDGKTWVNDKASVNQLTTDSVTVTPTQTANYRLTVSAWCGVISSNFTLTRVTTPTVTNMPANADVCPPTGFAFGPTVTGATSMQWQQNFNGGAWSDVAGATSASYLAPVVTTPGFYGYRIAATNFCGTSYGITYFTVNPLPSASITGSACQVPSGQPTTLTCNTDTFSPQFLWSPGNQTTQSITVSPTSTTTYTCTVRSLKNCTKTASYTVTVGSQVNAPVITLDPVSQTICAGVSNATLTAAATGTNVAYQWQKQNPDTSWSNVSGATASSYVAPASNATYRCVASNACGSVNSAPATVTVDGSKQVAAITAQPQSTYYCNGGSATLSVTATGSSLTYRWESSTDQSFWSTTGTGASTLTFSPAAQTYYRVTVSNVCNSVRSNVVWVQRVNPITITTQPVGGVTCGATFTLSVRTSADLLGATYQWQVLSGSIWTNIAGATSSSYFAPAAGTYRVIVADACGSLTSNQVAVSFGTRPGQPTVAGDSFIYAGQQAHIYVSNARFDWDAARWSDGGVGFDRYVSPTTTTSYQVYVTGASYSCPSPWSAPFQVTVSGGAGALPGGYQSGGAPAGHAPSQTASIAAAGTIVLLHGGSDKKTDKTLSVVRSPQDRILAGDWNGDGVGSLGFYDPKKGQFELWDGDPQGKADYRFAFGPPGRWQAIAGDWDGDGIDTIGLFDPLTGRVWLRNQNSAGAPDLSYVIQLPIQNGIAVTGDWTGKGYDTLGVYDPKDSVFYLKDTHTTGGPDHEVQFGPMDSGALPLSGDWDDEGLSAVGLYDSKTGNVYLRKTLVSGPPEYTQTFVPGLDQVFAGRWNADQHAPGGKQKKAILPRDSTSQSTSTSASAGRSSDWPRPGWLTSGHAPAESPEGFTPASSRSTSTAGTFSAEAATAGWNYTIRDENNKPSIEYHINKAGTVVPDRLYAYFGNGLVATYEFQPSKGVPGWIYYTTDHLGSVRQAGSKTFDYWPFGEKFVADPSGTPTVALRFAGMERDPASGNDYDHARYHGSQLGRFLSPDRLQGKIADPQSWNRYAYARNNPVKYFDPNGEDFDTYLAGIVDAVGSNMKFGIGRGQSTDSDFQFGQKVGDVLSFFQGAAEAAVGAGGELLGVTLDATGAGALVGVPVNAVSAVAAAHGAVVSASGLMHLANPTEGIYEGPDAKAPGKTYVGQSNDTPRRLKEHEASGKFPPGTEAKTTQVSGGKTAREVAEQRRINELGGTRGKPGSKTSNARNPIGEKRRAEIEKKYGPLDK